MQKQSRSSNKRSRVKQTKPLEERLAEHAERLREEAKSLPAGKRQAVLRRAEQAETFTDYAGLLRRPNSKTGT